MIAWFKLQHKPWSVVIVGQMSGRVSPPLRWLRWRSRAEAEQWVAAQPSLGLTVFEPIDLRSQKP